MIYDPVNLPPTKVKFIPRGKFTPGQESLRYGIPKWSMRRHL